MNDIGEGPELFMNAINGKYKNERRWISREDFFMLKESDPYVKYIWSFGNDGETYLYGADIEPLKKELHALITNEDMHERRRAWGRFVERYTDNEIKMEKLNYLTPIERLLRLEQMQHMQSLERLQNPQSLERLQNDYADVKIPDGAVVYCDIPYKGAKGYDGAFDHERFYQWLDEQENIVIVSEYTKPPHAVQVASVEKPQLQSANGGGETTEGLFVNERYYDAYREKMCEKHGEQMTLDIGG